MSTDQVPATSRADEPRRTYLPATRDYRRWGCYLTFLVAVVLALNEINLLSRGFVAAGYPATDFAGLSGPRVWKVDESWAESIDAADLPTWGRLLVCFLVVDGLFMVAYALVLRAVAAGALVPDGWERRVKVVVWGLVGADVVENLLMAWAGHVRVDRGGDVPSALLGLLSCVTGLKWLVVAALVVLFAVFFLARERGVTVKPWRSALWVQRYSLVAFLPVAALACLPVPAVGDQVPDIERRWLEGGVELWYLGAALLAALLVVSPAIFFLGRLRADCAFKRESDQGPAGLRWPWYGPDGTARRALLRHWLIAPAVAVVLCGITLLGEPTPDGRRLLWFCVVPVSIALLSRPARRRLNRRHRTPKARESDDNPSPARVLAVGDCLAIASVAVIGLGMVRAWSGLLAVGLASADVDVDWYLWLFLPAAAAAALLPWVVATTLLHRLDMTTLPEPRGLWRTPAELASPTATMAAERVVDQPNPWVRRILMTVAFVGLGLMAFLPVPVARGLGVVAAVNLALGLVMVLLGVTVAYAQETRPPEVFLLTSRPWLTATPIVPVILAGLVLTAKLGSPTFVHGIDHDEAVPARPSLATAFARWEAPEMACLLPATGDDAIRIRPMLLVAAEGGGIRATYWTAKGLAELVAAGGDACGERMTFFSTGASGGSLGLSIGRYSPDPVPAVAAIAGPDALGAGALALVTSDLIAATTGARLGAPGGDVDGSDRAALMQEAWEEQWTREGLGLGPADHRFVEDDDAAPTAVTGQLILTSTDAYDGCRALWSQIDLSPEPPAPDDVAPTVDAPGCGNGTAGPNSYDVLSAFGEVDATDEEGCLGNVDALTAGLVSGRFPYVTPSAVVGPCRGLKETPLVDGGIADNTGLGTIVDLAPQWGALVRDHNDAVLEAGTGELIVPWVVYLDNGPATDFGVAPRGDSIAESLAPLSALRAATTRRTPTSSLLRDLATTTRTYLCAETTPGCVELQAEQDPLRRVFVVHQATQPTLSAPLGWVLSQASRDDLDADLAEARDTRCGATDAAAGAYDVPDPVCDDGIGTLGDLMDRLEGVTRPAP